MQSTITTGAAGEHYVMYQLLSRGHLAALTPTGAKGVDILISDEDGEHLAALQVKTAGTEVRDGWQMDAKHERMNSEKLFYCFVSPRPTANISPTCWIVPSNVVAEHVRSTHRDWLAGTPLRGAQRKDSSRRKMHLHFKSQTLVSYQLGWMNGYRDAWHLLE